MGVDVLSHPLRRDEEGQGWGKNRPFGQDEDRAEGLLRDDDSSKPL